MEIGTIMSRTGGKEVLRMLRKFNITGICIPSKHYMMDMSAAIEEIEKRFIRQGEYFTINRARQYGKSTILELLYRKLKDQYIVIDMSFEAADDCFVSQKGRDQQTVGKWERNHGGCGLGRSMAGLNGLTFPGQRKNESMVIETDISVGMI